MEIKIVNNAPSVNISVEKESENAYAIKIEEKATKPLKEVRVGSIVNIGKHKYIVLNNMQGSKKTALVSAEDVTQKKFGASGNYETSDIRKYLNKEYYKELCATVGKKNIYKHMVFLGAADGTNKSACCEDFVSLITAENYYFNREYFPSSEGDDDWWTATRMTANDNDYSNRVCYVGYCGVLNWCIGEYSLGIRPYIVLNSSVRVTLE